MTTGKRAYVRSRPLLDLAKGRDCTVRLPGCTGGGEDTVAAHSDLWVHGKARNLKADDHVAAWACYACHMGLSDPKRYTKKEKTLRHLLGVVETLTILIHEKRIRVHGYNDNA